MSSADSNSMDGWDFSFTSLLYLSGECKGFMLLYKSISLTFQGACGSMRILGFRLPEVPMGTFNENPYCSHNWVNLGIAAGRDVAGCRCFLPCALTMFSYWLRAVCLLPH